MPELEYLRHVQAAFLPKTCPTCRDAHIYAHSEMFGGVGGDFYDFPEVADARRGLIIGDVTGHGLRAALVMAMSFGLVRGTARHTRRPDMPLRELNNMLVEVNQQLSRQWGIVLCTMFYGIFDPPNRKLLYANAGHPPPLACYGQTCGCALSQLGATAPPIGVAKDIEFVVHSIDLHDVRRLFFYTDGLLDVLGGARSGLRRLGDIMADTRGLAPELQLQAVFQRARRASLTYAKGHADDASAFLLEIPPLCPG